MFSNGTVKTRITLVTHEYLKQDGASRRYGLIPVLKVSIQNVSIVDLNSIYVNAY